jgi:hypothetical protein
MMGPRLTSTSDGSNEFSIRASHSRLNLVRNASDAKSPNASRKAATSGSSLDKDTTNNLRFLIGLRHETEHQMTRALDNYLSGRYQACALNFNEYLKKLFGKKNGIEEHLTYSIQFVQLAEEQVSGTMPAAAIPERLRAYIADLILA